MNDGRMVQVRRRDGGRNTGAGIGGKGEIVGVEPVVWDVGLGNREREEYGEKEGLVVKSDEEEVDETKEDVEKEEEVEVEVDGSWGEEWKVSPRVRAVDVKLTEQPLSATVLDHTTSFESNPTSASKEGRPTGTRTLDLSVLIAMPSPDTVPTHSTNSSTTSISCEKPLHLDDYPVQHRLPPDYDMLPVMEIGSTIARVKVRDHESAWAQVTKDVDERHRRRQKAQSGRR